MVAVKIGPPYVAEYMINPAMIRAARALLNWRQTDLATASGMALIAIKNIERGAVDPRVSTIARIEHAFDRAGIRFINADVNGGIGVRLMRRQPSLRETGNALDGIEAETEAEG